MCGRRGMGREVGGRASGLRGGAEVLGKGVSLCVGERRSSAGMGCAVGGECIAQPAGVRRRCVGDQKCSGRACRCAGGVSEDLRRGMGGEVGGFNAHSPQQHARTCIIIYTSALSTP